MSRLRRPLETDDDEIKAMIQVNPQYTTCEILEALHIAQSNVHDHLKKLGLVSKLPTWVSRVLKESIWLSG